MAPQFTDQRRQPTQARAKRTVTQILDAALDLFDASGFTATTMSAIAESAGVGIASLYQWFPTKEDVLLGLAERHLRAGAELLATVAAELREEIPPLDGVLTRFVTTAVELNADEARFHRQLFTLCPRTPPIVALLDALDGAIVDELVWHLRRVGLDHGAARLRAEIVVKAVEAVIHEVVIARLPGPERQRAIDETVTLALTYLEAQHP